MPLCRSEYVGMSTSAATATPRLPRAGTATDEQLVAAIRQGSDAAVSAMVGRYEAALLGFARKTLGGRHHDAEECVQDGLMNAVRALRSRPDAEISLNAWLHTIVRNRCLDHLRKAQRTTDIEPHAWALADTGPGPVSQIATRERLEQVVDGLVALPERQRQALVMHELEQCSHSMIGRSLGVTRGASKALVCRARRGVAETVSFSEMSAC
jgi:RNA polymerase sigma-70 factor (ECF subfamily)